MAAGAGLVLVDTKYEFGLDEQGSLTIIDEVHTPDSSRWWVAASYDERLAAGLEPESLDKEVVRRAYADIGYCIVYVSIIGESNGEGALPLGWKWSAAGAGPSWAKARPPSPSMAPVTAKGAEAAGSVAVESSGSGSSPSVSPRL